MIDTNVEKKKNLPKVGPAGSFENASFTLYFAV